MKLPVVRLNQPISVIVQRNNALPGLWTLYTGGDEYTNLGRFKGLVMGTRNLWWKFNESTGQVEYCREPWKFNESTRRVECCQEPTGRDDGFLLTQEALLYLPHYKTMAVWLATSRTAVPVVRSLVRGEVYGFGSQRQQTRTFVYYLPTVNQLDLPVELSGLQDDYHVAFSDFMRGDDLAVEPSITMRLTNTQQHGRVGT